MDLMTFKIWSNKLVTEIVPLEAGEIAEVFDAVTLEEPDIESEVEFGLSDPERLRVAVIGIVGAGICTEEEEG